MWVLLMHKPCGLFILYGLYADRRSQQLIGFWAKVFTHILLYDRQTIVNTLGLIIFI